MLNKFGLTLPPLLNFLRTRLSSQIVSSRILKSEIVSTFVSALSALLKMKASLPQLPERASFPDFLRENLCRKSCRYSSLLGACRCAYCHRGYRAHSRQLACSYLFPVQTIISGAANDGVISDVTVERIFASSPVQLVGANSAKDHILSRTSDNTCHCHNASRLRQIPRSSSRPSSRRSR